jgi:hypothetical protein
MVVHRCHLTLVLNLRPVCRSSRNTLIIRSMSDCLPLLLHTRITPLPIHPNCHHCLEYRRFQEASSQINCSTAQSTQDLCHRLQSICLSFSCKLIRSSVKAIRDRTAQFTTGNPFPQTASLSRLGPGITSGSLNTDHKIGPTPNLPMPLVYTAPI